MQKGKKLQVAWKGKKIQPIKGKVPLTITRQPYVVIQAKL